MSDNFSSMLEAFDALNRRKRLYPESLSEEEKEQWKSFRCELEKILFQQSPDPASDTREYVRVPVALTARYWSSDELKDRYIPVLGEGGLFISTVDPLPRGSVLDLEIALASQGLNFPVQGQVVWINEGDDPARRGMGIKFVNLTYEQKQIIYSLVDDTLRQHLLERRRFARVDARLDVEFVYAEGFFTLRTEDLGLGGMFIATEHLVPVGEKLRVVLHLPGPRPVVKADCEVVRVVEEPQGGQPAGIGVKFLDMDTESESSIRAFLAGKVSEPVDDEQERRRFRRIERQVKLRFQVSGAVMTSYARDISHTGVFIHTVEPPPVGSRVMITLVNPVTLQKLELAGLVARVVEPDPDQPRRLPGVGVAFEPMEPAQQDELRSFLREFVLINGKEEPGSGAGE